MRQDIGEVDVTKLARERRAQQLAERAEGGGGGGGEVGKWNDAPKRGTSRSLLLLNRSIYRSLLTPGALLIEEEALTPAETERRRVRAMAVAERKELRALDPARIEQLNASRTRVGDNPKQTKRLQA